MLHLNRGGPWIDIYGVRDDVSLTVPTDRDDVGELEESANDFLPQTGVPCSTGAALRRSCITNHLIFSP